MLSLASASQFERLNQNRGSERFDSNMHRFISALDFKFAFNSISNLHLTTKLNLDKYHMCAFLRRRFLRRLVRGPRLLISAFFRFFSLSEMSDYKQNASLSIP